MQEKEVFLVYADVNYCDSFENEDGRGGSQSHEVSLRGIATSEASAAGLILKDYVSTLASDDLDARNHPLVPTEYEGDDAFELHIDQTVEQNFSSYHIVWFIQTAVLDDLFEEE